MTEFKPGFNKPHLSMGDGKTTYNYWRRRGHVVDVSDTADSVIVLLFVVVFVKGVTQLGDVVYIVCGSSSTIHRFSATAHQRLTDIVARGVSDPWDIAACERMSQLYVADWECVWRVSPDGADIKRWLPKSPSDPLGLCTLSVTSSRLLVTSCDNQLIHLDAGGDELRRVLLPGYMGPRHAVESPSGTFIVSHSNTQLDQDQVSEVNTEGQVLRQFSGSRLGEPLHIAADSDGNIIVADSVYRHILLLDAKLALRRVIMDEHQLNYREPRRLCYMEQSGQLLVGFFGINGVAVFDVLRR